MRHRGRGRARALLALGLSLCACGGTPTPPSRARADATSLEPQPPPQAQLDAAVEDATIGGRLLHVSSEASDGGDGSANAPFRRLDAAALAAVPGDTVLLSAGRHAPLTVSWPEGVELWGGGRDATFLDGPLSLRGVAALRALSVTGGAPALTLTDASAFEVGVEASESDGLVVSGRVTLRDVALRGSADAGMRATDAVLDVDQLVVEGARGSAIKVVGGEGVLRGLRLRDVALGDDGVSAHGLDVDGARLRVVDVGVTGVLDRSLRFARDAEVELESARVPDAGSEGLSVLSGARVRLLDVRIGGASSTGLTVIDAHVSGRDVELRDCARAGLLVSEGTADLEDLRVYGGATRGISWLRAQGRLVRTRVEGAGNVGIQVTEPLDTRFEDLAIIGARETALSVLDAEPLRLQVVGGLIQDSMAGNESGGEGVFAYGASLSMQGTTITGSAGAGIRVEGGGLDAEQVTVERSGGPGLLVIDPTNAVNIVRGTFRSNLEAGMLALNGVTRCDDCRASGTRPLPGAPEADGFAFYGGTHTLSGGAAEENENAGIRLGNRGLLTVGGVVAARNGGWGLDVACDGSEVTITEPLAFDANGRGGRNRCP
jgi:hypothetical protein